MLLIMIINCKAYRHRAFMSMRYFKSSFVEPGKRHKPQIVAGKQASDNVHINSIRPDQNAGLAFRHASKNDARGFVGLCHGKFFKFNDGFLALRLGIRTLTQPGMAHNIGVDAARMNGGDFDICVGQIMARRIGKAQNGKFGGIIGGLFGHTEKPKTDEIFAMRPLFLARICGKKACVP